MWCKTCNKETNQKICEQCNCQTDEDVPLAIFWCDTCNIPIIKYRNELSVDICPSCGGSTKYLTTDLRPVFPEERLLLEIVQGKPLQHLNKSVWASNNRYYINSVPITVTSKFYKKRSIAEIKKKISDYTEKNSYDFFNANIAKFVDANKERLNFIIDEAHRFIKEASIKQPREQIVISFSGGKDSSVTADLAIKALSDPTLVHIFGNTTLELPQTIEYAERYRKNNPKCIFKTAINKEQNFLNVCDDIGPPARMLRWCCSMFKTGPITRVLNSLYREKSVLTFYGIRKCESISRSKYNRIEDNAETVKIHKQKVASPIFLWRDIDVWLYILSENVDFNDAYRLGYGRVGCYCCPNNSERSQFLTNLYLTEEYEKWNEFLIEFAKRIGKPDPEEYVNTGKWKARQGGNGIKSAQDVKLHFSNCTSEDNANIYQLNKPIDDTFYELFIPFGKLAPELGRKLINETIIVDLHSGIPIISIQPFANENFEYSVKIKTMNVAKHNELHRMISYQIRKYNACRKCLKCESLCRFGAIRIIDGAYHIDENKCKRCKMCVTAKYLESGCMMNKYLRTKDQ